MSKLRESSITPAMITALFSGLAVLTAALLAGVVSILVQLAADRRAEAIRAEEAEAQLKNITVLVDGTKSAMLRKIAVLMRSTADKSGLPKDIQMAEEAEREADEQEERVRQAVEAMKAGSNEPGR